MARSKDAIRILVIRPWTAPIIALRRALDDAQIAARFYRVDIEPALNAALTRGGEQLVIFDPRTPAIPRETLDACLAKHGCTLPVLELEPIETIASRILAALATSSN